MKTLEMKHATASLAEYARDVKKEPVILTVAGKPVAALVAIENADAETVSLSTNPRFLALIERSRAPLGRRGDRGSRDAPSPSLRKTAFTRNG